MAFPVLSADLLFVKLRRLQVGARLQARGHVVVRARG